MKIVKLSKVGSCCPVVNITDSRAGRKEKDNTYVLTMAQLQILKEILKREPSIS
jgi:hypothetical protein